MASRAGGRAAGAVDLAGAEHRPAVGASKRAQRRRAPGRVPWPRCLRPRISLVNRFSVAADIAATAPDNGRFAPPAAQEQDDGRYAHEAKSEEEPGHRVSPGLAGVSGDADAEIDVERRSNRGQEQLVPFNGRRDFECRHATMVAARAAGCKGSADSFSLEGGTHQVIRSSGLSASGPGWPLRRSRDRRRRTPRPWVQFDPRRRGDSSCRRRPSRHPEAPWRLEPRPRRPPTWL